MITKGDVVYLYGDYSVLEENRYFISLYGSNSPIITNSLQNFKTIGNSNRIKVKGVVKTEPKNGYMVIELAKENTIRIRNFWVSKYEVPTNTSEDVWRILGLVVKMHPVDLVKTFGTSNLNEVFEQYTIAELEYNLNLFENHDNKERVISSETEDIYKRLSKVLKMTPAEIESLTGQYLTTQQLFDNFSLNEILEFLTTIKEATDYTKKVDKMYTYLRGFCTGANMASSIRALQFARNKHKGQLRKDGQPYIVHPLSLGCMLAALDIRDDNLMSVALLHDVVEDCSIDIESLPFNDIIKTGVKYMTVTKFNNEDKATTKKRYFKELLESKEAVVVKALDRLNNLGDMEGALSEAAIIKNIKETNELLLPILREAKEIYPELSNVLYLIREMIKMVNKTLANAHKVYIEV